MHQARYHLHALTLQGKAPRGVEYIDVEEEYVVGPDGRGSWRPVKKDETVQQAGGKKGGNAVGAVVEEDEDAEELEGMLEDELGE